VNEPVKLLVGDKHQHEIERTRDRIDVIPRGHLLDPAANVGEESLAQPVRVGIVAFQETQVIRDGEFHIHVDPRAGGQQEDEVGLGAAFRGALLAVVDPFDHPRQAEHVLGHPLAPLPAMG
jgi:hypothetical protein